MRAVFSYLERQVFYDRQSWVEAGKGVRFSRLIPLSIIPPREPVRLQLLIANSSTLAVAATYYVSLTNPNMQGLRLMGQTPDIPSGSVFDVMHTISTTFLQGDYSITLFCLPHPPAVASSDPARHVVMQQQPQSTPLVAMDGSIPPGLPGLYGIFKVRTALTCPSCQGALQWVPEGIAGRSRGWVCGRCGYRLETGIL